MSNDNKLLRLDADKLAGLNLDELAPYPDEIVLSGESKHQTHHFDHDELLVAAYQAAPALLDLKDYPQDEFMYLLSGKIIVTAQNGQEEEFLPGQAFMLKKGFCGTFEMQGNVRKIAIMNGDKYSPLSEQ
jgi:uncharacterized protein